MWDHVQEFWYKYIPLWFIDSGSSVLWFFFSVLWFYLTDRIPRVCILNARYCMSVVNVPSVTFLLFSVVNVPSTTFTFPHNSWTAFWHMRAQNRNLMNHAFQMKNLKLSFHYTIVFFIMKFWKGSHLNMFIYYFKNIFVFTYL